MAEYRKKYYRLKKPSLWLLLSTAWNTPKKIRFSDQYKKMFCFGQVQDIHYSQNLFFQKRINFFFVLKKNIFFSVHYPLLTPRLIFVLGDFNARIMMYQLPKGLSKIDIATSQLILSQITKSQQIFWKIPLLAST